jgi:hypothetical protein
MDKRVLGIVAIAHSPTPSEDSHSASVKKRESLLKKKARIRQELIKAGMTPYGLKKFNSRYLPSLIKSGEHIHGVVYGRYAEGPGLLSWADRMIVATDHRIISFNHKPSYTDDDEITYDVVNGVDSSTAGFFSAITLDTRIGKVTIRFVNRRCATIFMNYVEKRRLDFFRTRTHPNSPPMEEED